MLFSMMISIYSDLNVVIFKDEGSVNDGKFSRHAIERKERLGLWNVNYKTMCNGWITYAQRMDVM